MEPILLTERCEYDYCVKRGYEPLLDIRNFCLDIRLRALRFWSWEYPTGKRTVF